MRSPVTDDMLLDAHLAGQVEAVHYVSGTKSPAEVVGLDEAPKPIGVTVGPRGANGVISRPAMERLLATSVPVFADSGAFSEVDRNLAVVRPFTEADWELVLGRYKRLAEQLGSRLSVVAPDRVGDQQVTLRRLHWYREHTAEVAASGAHVLVPLQRGAMTALEFAGMVDVVLGHAWVPAFPMCKGATAPDDVVDFCRQWRPSRVHLLGIGIAGRAFPSLYRALTDLGVEVHCDSCDHSRLARRLPDGTAHPKALVTRAKDRVLVEFMDDHAFGAPPADCLVELPDYDATVADLDAWLVGAERELLRDACGVEPTTAWLATTDGEWDWQVDMCWESHYRRISAPERKRRSIRMAFSPWAELSDDDLVEVVS